MARELRRLLITPDRLHPEPAGGVLLQGRLPLQREESHYLTRVLRLRSGDRLELTDGSGHLWSALLEPNDQLCLEQPLALPLQTVPPPPLPLRLGLALPKREAELVWRMATELGVDVLQPLIAARHAAGQKLPLERWKTVVREACEQCERLWLPVLEAPLAAADWLSDPPPGLALLATTRHKGLPLPAQVLQEAAPAGDLQGVTLAIGPEGGWSPEEETLAAAAGWCSVSLGGTILRTSTAAVAGLAQLGAWRSLSCPSLPWRTP
jgi:16S rRNA (uracil1498-N3)-methyltransferase